MITSRIGTCTVLLILGTAFAHAQSLTSNVHLRTIGPAVMSGRIVDLAVIEIDPYTFYVASATGGSGKPPTMAQLGLLYVVQFCDVRVVNRP